ncbi:MAG: hypothetical protein KIG37_06105, partial [Oscillospiraceae bacterium]|nr:hypothetical protein [Oscillospiraceae bacterium]
MIAAVGLRVPTVFNFTARLAHKQSELDESNTVAAVVILVVVVDCTIIVTIVLVVVIRAIAG